MSQQGVDPLALVLGLPAGLEDKVPQPMYGQQPDELPQLLHVMNSDLGELWTPIRGQSCVPRNRACDSRRVLTFLLGLPWLEQRLTRRIAAVALIDHALHGSNGERFHVSTYNGWTSTSGCTDIAEGFLCEAVHTHAFF